jgi:hypothetical protein
VGISTGAGILVYTQQQRADYYEHYTMNLLQSKACVGWVWYRFRDNDQTVYADEVGNLYKAFDMKDGKPSAYENLESGQTIDGPSFAPSLTIVYKGEGDISNVGSNKGIYDNKMNAYAELTSSIKKISDNVFALASYFDK